MKYFLSLLLLIPISSCIAADINDPGACETNSLSVSPPDSGSYAGIVGTKTFGVQADLSDMLYKLNQYGTVDLSVTKDQIVATTGNLNWIQHLTVNISPVTNTIDFSTLLLADQDVSNPGTEIKLNTLISNDNLYALLNQGVIEIDFTVTGVLPSETTDVEHTICTSAHIHTHESL